MISTSSSSGPKHSGALHASSKHASLCKTNLARGLGRNSLKSTPRYRLQGRRSSWWAMATHHPSSSATPRATSFSMTTSSFSHKMEISRPRASSRFLTPTRSWDSAGYFSRPPRSMTSAAPTRSFPMRTTPRSSCPPGTATLGWTQECRRASTRSRRTRWSRSASERWYPDKCGSSPRARSNSPGGRAGRRSRSPSTRARRRRWSRRYWPCSR